MAQDVCIALANLELPQSADHALTLALDAIAAAGRGGAAIVCFPETFLPGYRNGMGRYTPPPPDAAWLDNSLRAVGEAARQANCAVVMGTERLDANTLLPIISAAVLAADGTLAGYQDKEQIDPSEEGIYAAGVGRHVFSTGTLRFGIAICHEGWRYPESVRWAARRGAHLVFHPHLHVAEPGGYRPSATFADSANTFHEKALLCRAAENTCWIASVNCASAGSPTTSAIVRPDGTVHAWQPYGKPGLLIADIDLSAATGLLASRLKIQP